MSARIIPATFLDREPPSPRPAEATSLEFSSRTSIMHSTMMATSPPDLPLLSTSMRSSGAWALGSDQPTSSLWSNSGSSP